MVTEKATAPLTGKIALVAGATRGAGRAIAVELGAGRSDGVRDGPQQPRARSLGYRPPRSRIGAGLQTTAATQVAAPLTRCIKPAKARSGEKLRRGDVGRVTARKWRWSSVATSLTLSRSAAVITDASATPKGNPTYWRISSAIRIRSRASISSWVRSPAASAPTTLISAWAPTYLPIELARQGPCRARRRNRRTLNLLLGGLTSQEAETTLRLLRDRARCHKFGEAGQQTSDPFWMHPKAPIMSIMLSYECRCDCGTDSCSSGSSVPPGTAAARRLRARRTAA